MSKKVLAFDLDDTLAVTKSPISDEMGEALSAILDKFEVCIISGGQFGQFKMQVIDRLKLDEQKLKRLHLMPTCGTRYYKYKNNEWHQEYAEDLVDKEKAEAIAALEKCSKELGLWEEKTYGDIIEDRGSQITFSALGQEAPVEKKYAWDHDGSKKQALRAKVAELLPNLEVRAGGSTSIDITRIGIDKAYGMQKLIDTLGITKEDILFFGDKLQEGGNDYPVKAFGIASIEVSRWEDTVLILKSILEIAE